MLTDMAWIHVWLCSIEDPSSNTGVCCLGNGPGLEKQRLSEVLQVISKVQESWFVNTRSCTAMVPAWTMMLSRQHVLLPCMLCTETKMPVLHMQCTRQPACGHPESSLWIGLKASPDMTASHLNRAVSRVDTKPMERKLRAVLLPKVDLFFPAFSFRISESLL